MTSTNQTTTTFALLVVLTLVGCKDEPPSAAPPAGQPKASQPATSPSASPAATPDHPNRVELGTLTANGLQLKAMQDEPIKPGGEGAFDLLITGPKPKAVRFWVGSETAEGSVKAKAEEETPNNWHTHVEVPDPLPPGSRFWAQVEPASGQPFTVSFDFERQ